MAVDVGRKQTAKNLSLNIIAFVIQFAISFYIAPVIVGKVGKSAYGFIGLANDFVSYAGIIASVFNSVASRFIANEYYKKNIEKANAYFSSLIVANLVLSAIFVLSGSYIVWNIESILQVPTNLVLDVKITFALIFVAYIVTLSTVVFTTATYVTNRTDLTGQREIIKHILRFMLIIVLLNCVSVKIYWVAFSTLFSAVVVAISNIHFTRKLTPEIKITVRGAQLKYVKMLAAAGGWMAFTNISNLLIRGLDLTIANSMLGAESMGLLSIARTIPNNFTSAIGTIAPIFTPVFIIYYAQQNTMELIERVNKSVRTMALILFVPICGFIVYSRDFYSLWQKGLSSEEITIVTILSSATIIQAFFNSTTAPLAQLSVVVNKLKLPVFVSFGCGIVNIIIVITLIKYTNLGVYSIVISSTVIMLLRYILFNSFYAAKILQQRINIFLRQEIKIWLTIPVIIVVCQVIHFLIPVKSWVSMIISAAVAGTIGYAIIVCLLMKRDIKRILRQMIDRKGRIS